MGSFSTPINPPQPQPTLRPKASEDNAPKASEAANSQMAAFQSSMRANVAPTNLVISYDESAGRFVQTLTDANSEETLRRYPNDGQLAYSRAIMAYFRAMIEAVNKS